MNDRNLSKDLREAAAQCSRWDSSAATPPFSEWSDLMDNAADVLDFRLGLISRLAEAMVKQP